MVHNGIEYGLMQAYAEGFEILHASDYKLDLAAIADLWNHGSVVRSWLLELAASAFSQDQDLTHLKGWVADSGEGRWTVQEAIDKDVPAPVITLSAAQPLPLPPGRQLPGQGPGGAAERVRRPRGEDRVTAATAAASRPMSPTRAPVPPPPARTARQLREATSAARRRHRRTRTSTRSARASAWSASRTRAAFVLFGATGDLAHRKVIPAIYQLWRTNLLPAEFSLVAVARRPYTDEAFAAEVRASLEKYSRVQPIDEAAWAELAKRITYQQLDFGDDAGFDRLGDAARRPGRGARHGRQPALLPGHAALAGHRDRPPAGPRRARPRDARRAAGGASSSRSRSAATYESARRLNHEVGKVFRESQVYRIDHYLGKETVRNLLVFRFGNGIFEPVWNRSYVDHVQITVAESIGVEGRGAFYEETGASRDILQNHLLQLMTLVAMEPPSSFHADALRDQKLQVLRAIAAPDAERRPARRRARPVRPRLGRRRAGRRATAQEPEVDPESETETYVAGRFTIDDWRWSGVPVLPAGRQAAAQARHGDRDPVQGSAAAPSSASRPATRRRTSWRCGSSPTRASCSASRPRCRAWAWTSGR